MRSYAQVSLFALALAACGGTEGADSALASLVTSQQATLLASDGANSDAFGLAADISDDGLRVIVGAPNDDTAIGGQTAGSFRIFRHAGGGTWVQEAVFVGSQARAFLGYAVSLDATGSRAVIGAYQADLPGPIADAGTAFVFVRDGTSWSYEATLAHTAPAANDWFGLDVGISGDGQRVIVGVSQDDTIGGLNSGSARVFSRAGPTWTEEALLTPSSPAPNDGTGGAVSLSFDGSIAAVGTEFGDVMGIGNAGFVTVFARVGASWSEIARLVHPAPAANDFFGSAVSLSGAGDRVLIGAQYDDAPADSSGSAAVFVDRGTSWTMEGDLLLAEGGAATDVFGQAVSLSADGSHAVIGASQDSVPTLGALIGSARVFLRTGSIWAEEAALYAPDAEASDFLGRSVAISGDGSRIVAGAYNDTTPRGITGSARVFAVAPSPVGAACSVDAACSSGFCADGVCCSSRCAGATTCQACSAARTGGVDGTCAPLTPTAAASTVCRAARDVCDAPESCTAGVLACPADARAPAGTVCRAASGDCDAAEACSGLSDACPADVVRPSGAVCRASTRGCDVSEVCDGASSACPSDVRAAAGTPCRASAGACDLEERCDGVQLDCPPDAILPAGSVCRSTGGPCDVEEVCTGSSPICPIDDFRPPSVTCRAAISSCDRAELCTGASALCPPDLFEPPTTVCRPASGAVCDAPDTCSGTSADCVERFLAGVVCREGTDACDASEVCSGGSELCPPDVPASSGTTCRASIDPSCDPTETCDGVSVTCPAEVNACVLDGGGPDAGTSDGGASDAGEAIAATGCSCGVAGRTRPWPLLAALAVLGMFHARRRARRPAARR